MNILMNFMIIIPLKAMILINWLQIIQWKMYELKQLAYIHQVQQFFFFCCILTSTLLGHLFGVFDGHAGQACAQVIAKRLLRYIGASLVPPDTLRQQLSSPAGAQSHSFLKCHNDEVYFVDDIAELYEKSFSKFAHELCQKNPEEFQMELAIENAFLRLDEDISGEALERPDQRTMSVAMSGAVACAVHIDGSNVYVGSTGDCLAVLGSITEEGRWRAKKLSTEHTAHNMSEVRRIFGEHPPEERDTVLREDRLLGQLAPLRAFGDFRYKWSRKMLEELVVPIYGQHVIAPNFATPPYLTAKPDVTHHILTPRDRFMVIGSDGLWDVLTPIEVVMLIGEHISGKASLQPLKLPKKEISLSEVSKLLSTRK